METEKDGSPTPAPSRIAVDGVVLQPRQQGLALARHHHRRGASAYTRVRVRVCVGWGEGG